MKNESGDNSKVSLNNLAWYIENTGIYWPVYCNLGPIQNYFIYTRYGRNKPVSVAILNHGVDLVFKVYKSQRFK